MSALRRYRVAVFRHPEHEGTWREFTALLRDYDKSWIGYIGCHDIVAKDGREAKRLAINIEREKREMEPK